MRTPTFLSPVQVRSTVESSASFLLGACFLAALLGATALLHIHIPAFSRTTPGRHARRSARVAVPSLPTLEGSKLTLKGSFSGLLAVPTAAHLAMGSLPGVRGPVIADLTISPATSGTLSGTVQLNPSSSPPCARAACMWRSIATRRPRAIFGAGSCRRAEQMRTKGTAS